MNIEGKDKEAVTTPRRKGESVISNTSQARANTRMLRPMFELARPAINRAKFRFFKGVRRERIRLFKVNILAIQRSWVVRCQH